MQDVLQKQSGIPGNIEEHGLEEEREADPLVVLVVLPARPVPGRGRHPGVRNLAPNLTVHLHIRVSTN